MTQQSHSWTSERENFNTKRCMHPSVPCSAGHNSQDPGNNLNVHQQMNKQRLRGTYIQRTITATKNSKMMPSAATRMNLEIITLSEESQRQISS